MPVTRKLRGGLADQQGRSLDKIKKQCNSREMRDPGICAERNWLDGSVAQVQGHQHCCTKTPITWTIRGSLGGISTLDYHLQFIDGFE